MELGQKSLQTQAAWLGTGVLIMSSRATRTLQFLLRVHSQTMRSLHGCGSFSEAWQERAPWVVVHPCSPVPGGGTGPGRQAEPEAGFRPPSSQVLMLLAPRSWGMGDIISVAPGGNQLGVHTPHLAALVLTQAHTFQPSSLDAGFFSFFSNGQYLLPSP